ncbi:hypothetical protein [Algoriphagus sp.]|uniref:hypothetical protein n=1 Tax=Algoriphagus sp. TaxID=1872435 RepID=UPI0025F5B9DD|nr:hypothetical protein [Algoriphagus sp.]
MNKNFFSATIIIATLFCFVPEAKSQIGAYNTTVGIRGGTSVGGSVKRFVTDHDAIELMVYTRWKGWVGNLLFEHHMDIREFEGLEWYIGGGGHYGIWKVGKSEPPWVYKATEDYAAFGVDAIVGLDYNINRSNWYISLDWKPSYNFQDFTGLWWDETAFTLRYSF